MRPPPLFLVDNQRVSAAVKLVSQLRNIYVGAEDAVRKRINQAVWDCFDVDDNGVVGARLTDPMAALVADDVVRALGAESENRDHCNGAHGSRLTGLVEVTGFEPATSTMRTSRFASKGIWGRLLQAN